jgi:hypothetical protein
MATKLTMDPLSFLILRRIAAKIADWIDKLIDLWALITLNPAPREMEERMSQKQPGAPGYLPGKERDAR